jgi:4'-phosphopantetheinyl transferase
MNNDSPDNTTAAGPAGDSGNGDPRRLPSPVAGIDLWWCTLQPGAIDTPSLAANLSPAEHARAARFGTEDLRRRWIVGRLALRRLLGTTLGIAPAEVPIQRGLRGRPELVPAILGIDFNVSHTRGVALIAIGRGLPAGTRLGVDVERDDRDVGADRLALKFLTARERATLVGRNEDERRRRFLHYWTCKEAMSKATGDGLAAPFGQLDVDLDVPPRLVGGPAPYDPARWTLRTPAVPDDYRATLAIWAGA